MHTEDKAGRRASSGSVAGEEGVTQHESSGNSRGLQESLGVYSKRRPVFLLRT